MTAVLESPSPVTGSTGRTQVEVDAVRGIRHFFGAKGFPATEILLSPRWTTVAFLVTVCAATIAIGATLGASGILLLAKLVTIAFSVYCLVFCFQALQILRFHALQEGIGDALLSAIARRRTIQLASVGAIERTLTEATAITYSAISDAVRDEVLRATLQKLLAEFEEIRARNAAISDSLSEEATELRRESILLQTRHQALQAPAAPVVKTTKHLEPYLQERRRR